MNVVLTTGFCLIFQLYAVNAGWLGMGILPSKEKDLMDDYKCPGKGHYAVSSKDVKEHCKKYFTCLDKGSRPSALNECDGEKKFHRLTRECEKEKFVDCKLCAKKGKLEDLTSKKHFIVCSHDQISTRYKCKEGHYDPKKEKCDSVKGDMDLEEDAKEDKVGDVQEFEEKWKEEKKGRKKDKDSDEK